MKKISIILPTYNERDNVDRIYKAITEVITQLGLDYEIIFVDDDSPDGTIDIVKQLEEAGDISLNIHFGF